MPQLLSPRFKFDDAKTQHPKVSQSQYQLIDLVKAKLERGDYHLQPCNCPCGANHDIEIAEVDRYGLPLTSVICLSCGTVRFNPYFDDNSLSNFYTHIYRDMYDMDRDVDGYERYFNSQRTYAEKVLAVAEPYLTPESWVCEVGCGGGGALKVFQERGYRVAGCDYDRDVMAIGRQHGVNNLCYGSLNAIAQELGDVKFDLIYLHHVFEHLTDPVQFLQECRSYLTPTGKIMIIVPDISRIDQFGHAPAIGNLLMYLHIAHKYNFSLDGICRLSQQAGFAAEKIAVNDSLKTPWSASPELWVQMSLAADAEALPQQSPREAGQAMLRYLQRTEWLYQLGLCHGQIMNRLKALRSPQTISRKVKKLLSFSP